MSSAGRSVALVTLGCARNEVDSEELAGRLGSGGWTITDDAESADVVMVNTCGFIESAKTDSIDELFRHTGGEQKVVAVGCMAERYGSQLAEAFTEGTVLGFDSYADIAARLDDVAAGRPVPAHQPRDRRTLLPVAPAQRQAASDVSVPGHGWVPDLGGIARHRADDAPVAYLKLASGCDRRCTFCAIPSFRGSFVSRPPADVLAEAAWLAGTGVRELVLVSENSTSYGKDLGDLRALETLLPELGAVDGIERVRISYLQPAEMRPGLIEAIARTPGVAPYFDLSFQHASEPVLRRMKRFGGTGPFLDLLRRARELAPDLGARSNFIVGFPGETEADVAELEDFLAAAGLDAIGVFGYSDEDGTDAADFDGKIDPDVIAERKERIQRLADELIAQRAEDRVGTRVEVLVEEISDVGADVAAGGDGVFGRAAHQGPEVDGSVRLVGELTGLTRGCIVPAFVVGSEGVDLLAEQAGEPR